MTIEGGCELLAKAKALAVKRGVSSDAVTCPIQDICKRRVCVVLSDMEQLEAEQEDPKYFERQKENDKS